MSAHPYHPPQAERRLFFALWPDEALRAELGAALAGVALPGVPVASADWHVTLEFLGNVDAARIDELRALGRGANLPDVTLKLDELQWWRRPGLVVASARGAPRALLELQSALRSALAAAGFRVDARDYRPHVTLARRVGARPTLTPITPLAWPIATLALVESAPSPSARYRPLASWTR